MLRRNPDRKAKVKVKNPSHSKKKRPVSSRQNTEIREHKTDNTEGGFTPNDIVAEATPNLPKKTALTLRRKKPVTSTLEEVENPKDEASEEESFREKVESSDSEEESAEKVASSDSESDREIAEEIQVSHPKTVLFIQAFPKLTEPEFEALIAPYKNRKTSVAIKFNGFQMTYDPSKGFETAYERYAKHFTETEDAIVNHMRNCKSSHKKYDVDIKTIATFNLPTDPKILEKKCAELNELHCTDEVYFNAHGNENLMGLGSLTMEPHEIAKALENLGIPKEEPPHIILWSCKSAKDEEQKGLAEKVTEQLEKLGYKSPMVTGTTELLFNQARGLSYVGTRVKNRKGEEHVKKVKNSESLKTFSTPKQKKILDETEIPDRARLFTQNLLKSKARRKRFYSHGSPVKRVLFTDAAKRLRANDKTKTGNDTKKNQGRPSKS